MTDFVLLPVHIPKSVRRMLRDRLEDIVPDMVEFPKPRDRQKILDEIVTEIYSGISYWALGEQQQRIKKDPRLESWRKTCVEWLDRELDAHDAHGS